MAGKPIMTPLPADLPEDWVIDQIVSPNGAEAGLDEKHGYNYQARQINEAQRGVNALNEAVAGKADLVGGTVPMEQLPAGVVSGDIDCGTFEDAEPLALHETSRTAHPGMVVDGNAAGVSAAESLEEHMADPLAHPNINLDGNMN